MTASNAAKSAGKIVINAAIPVTTVLAGLAWLSSHGVGLFVYRTDFNDYVAKQAFAYTRDSLIRSADVNALRLDVAALVRACQRKGECP